MELRRELRMEANVFAEDDDLDELEDPLAAIDVEGFVAGALRSAHAAGRLAPLAANLDRRRQQALMTLLA